jgi:hypothetical protein
MVLSGLLAVTDRFSWLALLASLVAIIGGASQAVYASHGGSHPGAFKTWGHPHAHGVRRLSARHAFAHGLVPIVREKGDAR